MNCGQISKNLALAACGSSNPAIEPEILLLNFDDWKKATKEIDGNVLSSLVLEDGAYAYRYQSHKNAFETDCTLNKGTYASTFTHKVVARIFAKTQENKDELNKLKDAKVVVIVQNSDTSNDETRYELYGADNGLVMSELTAPSTDTDGVIYNFTMQSDDNATEGALPLSVYKTSLTATKAMIEALVYTAATEAAAS